MPNQPMFTGRLQAQASAGAALDHVEAQGAISVLPFLGFTGNVFRGTKNRKFYEYGAAAFCPLNNKKNVFIYLGAGRGEGQYSGTKNIESYFNFSRGYKTDSKFSSTYIQPAIYFLLPKDASGGQVMVGVGLKHEELFFKHFEVSYQVSGGLSSNTYAFYNKADNGYAIIQTPFLFFTHENKTSPFYINAQFGVRNVLKQFSTVNYKFTGNANARANPLNDSESLFFQRYMINITIGIKLDRMALKLL